MSPTVEGLCGDGGVGGSKECTVTIECGTRDARSSGPQRPRRWARNSSLGHVQFSIGVIIPARNDAAGLPKAVASVLTQQDADLASIVVAVGPSIDDTMTIARGLVEKDQRIRVIENPSGRTPEALNLAIDASTTDVIVRVDARSELPPGYVAMALQTMHETGAGNVGAIQRPVGDTVTQRAIASAMRSPLGSGGADYRSSSQRKQVDTAYLGVFRRDALCEVGGYDESFVRNQDAELNLRLAAAGHAVWLDPRLVVEYRPRPSLRALAAQYWQYGWWRQRTARKHPGSLRLRQLAAPVVVVGASSLVVLAASTTALWLMPVGVYAGALIVAGLSASSGGLRERLTMSAALATMHLSWGAGFLASLVWQNERGR